MTAEAIERAWGKGVAISKGQCAVETCTRPSADGYLLCGPCLGERAGTDEAWLHCYERHHPVQK